MITASTHKALIRLASSMPKGSDERKAILRTALDYKVTERDIDKAKTLSGVDPALAKHIVETGLKDGDPKDDKIPMGKANVAAGKLKPSQTTMQLPKTIGMAIAMLLGKMPLGGDLGAIISADNHILDGHHRWSAAIAAGGPGVSVGGYKAKQKGADLLKVLNIVTKGLFGRSKGNPGSGNIKAYTPANAEKMLRKAVEEGLPGKHPISPEAVQQALTRLGGSVEDGIKQMSENIGAVSKAVPSWAPDRVDMPVINEKDLPATSQALNKGIVNWNTPFDSQTKKALLRLASTLPVGSPERRVILAGCEKLPAGKMRENCEKSKKDGVQPGKGKSKSKSKSKSKGDKMPAELLEKFKAKKKASKLKAQMSGAGTWIVVDASGKVAAEGFSDLPAAKRWIADQNKKKAALSKGVQQLLAQLQTNPDSTLPLKEATWLGSRRWDHANVLGNLGLVEWAPGGRGLRLTPKGKGYRLASAATKRTARLMKRQEKILRQYLDVSSNPVMEFDGLPTQIQNALKRVKNQETLWSDVERWLWDNSNPHLRWAKNRKASKRFAGHHLGSDGEWYVDTAFINKCQRVSGVTVHHMGFGEFYAETPRGRVDFDRMRGKKFEGQSGRSHLLWGNAGRSSDAAVEWLVEQVAKGGHSERMARTAGRLDGVRGHKLMPGALKSKIPKLYAQENEKDPMVYAKFFSPYTNALWLVTEYDGADTMFGWADLGYGMGELGYISLSELDNLHKGGLPLVERDLYFRPAPLSKAKRA